MLDTFEAGVLGFLLPRKPYLEIKRYRVPTIKLQSFEDFTQIIGHVRFHCSIYFYNIISLQFIDSFLFCF